MRELPEPDGDHDRVFERGTVVYTRESVLAIQKQAYEDGLRDAADKTNKSLDVAKYQIGTGLMYLRSLEPVMYLGDPFGKDKQLAISAIYDGLTTIDAAMLTASQKEQQ